jgi:uncharacterized protein (TIGR03437 family)
MKRLYVFLAAVVIAPAQPVVTGVANVASFAVSPLPHSGIAQGSMFTVFGSGLGPASIQLVSSFPLPTMLGGTSIRVTVGGTTTDAIMIFSLAGQVAAILPSNTPPGNGTLIVSFASQSSAAFPIRVVRSSFGIFALNQAGSGPAIVTDPNFVPNTLVQSANPGDVMILWGTGLGPVPGDEAAGPLPGDLNLEVRVLVGGRPAQIAYRGRSGCCAGIDQIAFTIPEGVEGCYVPVTVVVGGVPSNFTSMSVAPSGRLCSDRLGLAADRLQAAQSAGALRVGRIVLNRSQVSFAGPPLFPETTLRSDTASASFGRYSLAQLLSSQVLLSNPAGSCTVFQFRGEQPGFTDPVRPEFLDAGTALSLTGPQGPKQIPRVASTGLYGAQLGGGGENIPGLGTNFQPDYLEPGAYTVTNGAGTAAVGSFSANLTAGENVTWSNRASVRSVNRSEPLTVTWSGGDPAEFVDITGFSSLVSLRVGAAFVCRERRSAGAFTIPVEVLAALPPSETQEGLPTGQLSVDASPNPILFQAAGLDLGVFSLTRISATPVAYR